MTGLRVKEFVSVFIILINIGFIIAVFSLLASATLSAPLEENGETGHGGPVPRWRQWLAVVQLTCDAREDESVWRRTCPSKQARVEKVVGVEASKDATLAARRTTMRRGSTRPTPGGAKGLVTHNPSAGAIGAGLKGAGVGVPGMMRASEGAKVGMNGSGEARGAGDVPDRARELGRRGEEGRRERGSGRRCGGTGRWWRRRRKSALARDLSEVSDAGGDARGAESVARGPRSRLASAPANAEA